MMTLVGLGLSACVVCMLALSGYVFFESILALEIAAFAVCVALIFMVLLVNTFLINCLKRD